MNENTKNMVRGLAAGAQAIASASKDPRVVIPARATALLLNMVARLLERRTAEEVAEILGDILASGATPIDQEELDAQVETILAELRGAG